MKKILVCGGRDYNNKIVLYGVLDRALEKFKELTIIHGGAEGADKLAGEWAEEYDVPVIVFPANWKKFGKRAGFIRNAQMLDEGKPSAVIAFPGGRGTKMMIELAAASDVPTLVIRENSNE